MTDRNSGTQPVDDRRKQAEEILSEHLTQQAAKDTDLNALCAEHPELAERTRSYNDKEDERSLHGGLGRLVNLLLSWFTLATDAVVSRTSAERSGGPVLRRARDSP